MSDVLLAAGGGFQAPGPQDFESPPVFSWAHWKIGSVDFVINRAMFWLIVGAVVVFFLFYVAFRRPKLVPRGFQNVMESVYDFVREQIALEVIGPQGEKFVPYLTTMFVFILLLNIGEITPFVQFPASSRIAVPAMFAVISFVVFNWVGIRSQGPATYFKDVLFLPGVPKPMYVLLTPIEFFSTFIVRPFTLAVRLFANMFAGHLLLLVFFLGTTYLLQLKLVLLFSGASFLMSIIVTFFELLIDLLQAYIFTMLTAVYISGAVEPEH